MYDNANNKLKENENHTAASQCLLFLMFSIDTVVSFTHTSPFSPSCIGVGFPHVSMCMGACDGGFISVHM